MNGCRSYGISQLHQLDDKKKSVKHGIKMLTEHFHRSFYRYRAAYQKNSNEGKKILIDNVRKAAYTMIDPADLINVAIEALINAKIELPAFSSLDVANDTLFTLRFI